MYFIVTCIHYFMCFLVSVSKIMRHLIVALVTHIRCIPVLVSCVDLWLRWQRIFYFSVRTAALNNSRGWYTLPSLYRCYFRSRTLRYTLRPFQVCLFAFRRVCGVYLHRHGLYLFRTFSWCPTDCRTVSPFRSSQWHPRATNNTGTSVGILATSSLRPKKIFGTCTYSFRAGRK